MEACKQQQALIPGYLDGELSEAQAAPLRQHLLACQDCRNQAQGEKSLKAWFRAEGAVTVPDGFAARIARRAFDGDTGDTGEPAAPVPAREETPILRFVLAATSVAAAVLLVLAVALRSSDLPSSDRLRADSDSPQQLEEVLRELDRVNAAAESEARKK
jgi:anti-sigma factor RsiW